MLVSHHEAEDQRREELMSTARVTALRASRARMDAVASANETGGFPYVPGGREFLLLVEVYEMGGGWMKGRAMAEEGGKPAGRQGGSG